MEFITCSVFVLISYMIRIISSNISEYNYEKINKFGLGRRLIPDYRNVNPVIDFGFNDQHPAPLPTPSKTDYIAGPYHTIFQGKRRKGDFRVYAERFQEDTGNRYFCEARLNCIISHIAVKTDNGTPILLRGGVGYRHFYVIARPPSGATLNGTVAVYCMRSHNQAGRRYQYGLVGKEGEYIDQL